MSDPTIAFLPQPVETLAREGEGFAQRVIHTLHEWVESDRTDHVVTQLHKRLFVLSQPAADWNMVVIVRDGHHRKEWGVDVCSVGFSQADELVTHFRPLADIEQLASVIQVRLHKIEPMMFAAVAESFAGAAWHSPADKAVVRNHSHIIRLLRVFDRNAHRWASSKARSNFKALLDDARRRPQLVEREDDDLFVVSRRYLQEAVEPTSARELSRRYAAMALPDAGMPDRAARTLAPLGDLPDLGSE